MSALSNAQRFNSSSSSNSAIFITDPPSASAAVGEAEVSAERALMACVSVSIGWHQTSVAGVTASPLDGAGVQCSISRSSSS